MLSQLTGCCVTPAWDIVRPMTALPDGVVTYLFNDVGEARVWEDSPDVMTTSLRAHDDVMSPAVEAYDGTADDPCDGAIPDLQ